MKGTEEPGKITSVKVLEERAPPRAPSSLRVGRLWRGYCLHGGFISLSELTD